MAKDPSTPTVIDLNSPPIDPSIEDFTVHRQVSMPDGTPGRTIGVMKDGAMLAVPEGSSGDTKAEWVRPPSPTKVEDTGSKATAMAKHERSESPTFEPLDPQKDSMTFLGLDIPTGEISIPREQGLSSGWEAKALAKDPSAPGGHIVKFEREEIGPQGERLIASKNISLGALHRYLQGLEKLKVEQSRTPEQKAREDYIARLFQPPQTVPKEQPEADFSHLFSDTDEAMHKKVEDAAVQRSHSPQVTEESRQGAISSIAESLLSDTKLQGILNIHGAIGAKDRDASNQEKLELIRKAILTNPGLRIDLAHHYLARIHNLAVQQDLPERVGRGKQKALYIPVNGLRHASSEDYVALLCISMLDGTFDPSKESEERYDWLLKKGTGQHRAAARLVLFGYR